MFDGKCCAFCALCVFCAGTNGANGTDRRKSANDERLISISCVPSSFVVCYLRDNVHHLGSSSQIETDTRLIAQRGAPRRTSEEKVGGRCNAQKEHATDLRVKILLLSPKK